MSFTGVTMIENQCNVEQKSSHKFNNAPRADTLLPVAIRPGYIQKAQLLDHSREISSVLYQLATSHPTAKPRQESVC